MTRSNRSLTALIVFDDRLPHAVERIDGSMDPTEGRFVLHGHLSEGGTIIEGPLPVKSVAGPLMELLRQFKDEYSAEAALYNGPLVFRLTVDADGAVAGCEVIVDRVIDPDRGHVDGLRFARKCRRGLKTCDSHRPRPVPLSSSRFCL